MYHNERPMSLSIVAVLWWISGGLAILGGLVLMGLGAAGASFLGATAFAVGLFLGLFCFFLGGVGIVVGMGLWRMQTWAWWVAVILTAITVFFALVSIIAFPLAYLSMGPLLLVLLYIGTLALLFTTEAREACGVSGGYRPPRQDAFCPNPRCRRQIRATWHFCPACRTQLNTVRGRPVAARY